MVNFFGGFLLAGSMIMAIGAQNVYVIRNGIAGNHIFWISLTCFLCDFLLMTIGVFGVGQIIKSSETLSLVIAGAAVIFLMWYGALALSRSIKGDYSIEDLSAAATKSSVMNVVAVTLAMSLINPHVWLDTVVVVGGVSSTLIFSEKIYFILGALLASAVWFFGLGYLSRLFVPFFKNVRAWRILDGCICVFMWFLGLSMMVFIAKSVHWV